MPGCRGSGGGVSVLVKQSRLMSSSRKYTIQINYKSAAVKYIPSARQPLQAVLSTYDSRHKCQPGLFTKCDSVWIRQNRNMQQKKGTHVLWRLENVLGLCPMMFCEPGNDSEQNRSCFFFSKKYMKVYLILRTQCLKGTFVRCLQ